MDVQSSPYHDSSADPHPVTAGTNGVPGFSKKHLTRGTKIFLTVAGIFVAIFLSAVGYVYVVSEPAPPSMQIGSSLQALCSQTNGVYEPCPSCPRESLCPACIQSCACGTDREWSETQGCVPILKAGGEALLCKKTGGTFIGCPECPTGAVCEMCIPCQCPEGYVWSQGCVSTLGVFPIDSSAVACVFDSDCVSVATQCSDCSCGAAINRSYQVEYKSKIRDVCKNYSGKVCDFKCLTTYSRCENNICILSNQPGVIVEVLRSGGLCPRGTCSNTWTLYRDGTYVNTIGGTEIEGWYDGSVEEVNIANLAVLISRADFDAIKTRPFTGVCPTAFDGSETTYTFYTNRGPESFSNCEVLINASDEPFATIERLSNAEAY